MENLTKDRAGLRGLVMQNRMIRVDPTEKVTLEHNLKKEWELAIQISRERIF